MQQLKDLPQWKIDQLTRIRENFVKSRLKTLVENANDSSIQNQPSTNFSNINNKSAISEDVLVVLGSKVTSVIAPQT